MGSDCINNLLGQIFDKDQRGDEHISFCDISTEIGVVALVSKLLNQVATEFNSQM